jgi:multisubunit Na+/H+ antiporter MnhG subunit
MSLFAVCTIFICFYIGSSLLPLQTRLLPIVAVLLVVGPLVAIMLGRYLLERNNPPSRKDDGSSGPKDARQE